MDTQSLIAALSDDIALHLFPTERALLPNLDDVYELQLAFYENLILSDAELLRNGAYFAKVGETYTRHRGSSPFLRRTSSELATRHMACFRIAGSSTHR